MIDRKEIAAAANELQVNPADIERDYVYGWLLSKIYGDSPLGTQLILKGGNALRKGYFPNTRYSGDLDFVTQGPIDCDSLRSSLLDVCDAVTRESGVVFVPERAVVKDKDRLDKSLQVVEARLFFNDFYGKPGNVIIKARMDVTQYERLLIDPRSVQLIHPYSDAEQCKATIRAVALEEILASKLKCLLQRRHVADLFDYVHWLAFGNSDVRLSEVLRIFLRKTIYSKGPGAAFRLLLGLPFQFLRDAWDRYIVCPVRSFLKFEDAMQRFVSHLDDLFRNAGWTGSLHGGTFFPPDLRNVILEAGSRLTLLKMTYNDEERLVEPYSLKFLEKKDGDEREYFWGYNASGGSSPPGIRVFTSDKFQAATVTDIPFTPRYPVEVSKAGDVSQAGSFATRRPVPSFGFTRQPRRRALSRPYMFRCPVCNRRFSRTTFDTSPNAHKRRGTTLQCFGAYLVYEGTRY
jgi:predicted nucleotidyltransferase component of viral defense system